MAAECKYEAWWAGLSNDDRDEVMGAWGEPLPARFEAGLAAASIPVARARLAGQDQDVNLMTTHMAMYLDRQRLDQAS